ALSLLALAVMGMGNPSLPRARLSLLLLLALAGSIVPHVVKGWNVAETMADSQFYVKNSARPPMYPWFIAAARGDAAWSDDDFRLQRAPLPHPSLAILRVVRAQRLVLWSCFLIAAWAVSFLVPRPLAVLFFFLLHRAGYLLPNLERCLMSEPLALAMLYLVVA